MSQMRQWVIKRGEKYLTANGGWSKDVAKGRVWDNYSEPYRRLRLMEDPRDAAVVPHWVSGEAW